MNNFGLQEIRELAAGANVYALLVGQVLQLLRLCAGEFI
jgi:hypothetical protein